MQFNAFVYVVAYLVALSCAKSMKNDRHSHKGEAPPPKTPKPRLIEEEPREMDNFEQHPENDILASARQRAIQVIMEKMLIALGPDFLKENHGAPDNETYPTVASPLNITTDPCPEIYTKCSSEIFFSSCHPPGDTDSDLWSQRLNLYFELPHDLLASDQLLNATLRIYKNNSLPLNPSSKLIVELYVYSKSLTKAYDINFLYDSRVISNNYIGWISFDTTDLIRKLDLKEHHGFLIKVKEAPEVYWNDPTLIIPMNCSDKNKTVVPVPFGVITDQPEQKFPSLTIHTGMLDQYYYNSEMVSEDILDVPESPREEEVEEAEEMQEEEEQVNEMEEVGEEQGGFMEEMFIPHKSHHHKRRKGKRHHNYNGKKMSGDDPRAHDEIYSFDGEPSELQQEFDIVGGEEEEEEEEEEEVEGIEEEEEEENAEAGEAEHIPVGFGLSQSRNLKRNRYNSKAFRKPDANQVYNGLLFKEDLNSPTPSALLPFQNLPPSKDWRNSNMWSPTETNERHQQGGGKKRVRPRRRHHNQHHQGENGDSHRSHSHFHTHPHPHTHPHSHPHSSSHTDSHHPHNGHETHEHHNRRVMDLSLNMDS